MLKSVLWQVPFESSGGVEESSISLIYAFAFI